jgi:4-aminobutyrate aminotransferase-like enzyme
VSEVGGTLGASVAASLIERRRSLLGPAYRLFYKDPLHLVRGEGCWLYDADGNAYLDAYNNVACVGHCHPHVVAEMTKQARTLNTHTRYLDERVLDYADRLTHTFPSELARVMFTCTGSEANELACQIARTVTGATGFIVTENAYHGNTLAISGLSPAFVEPGNLAPSTRCVPAPSTYRGSRADVAGAFAEDVRGAVQDLESHGMRPAALLVDLAFASDGIQFDPPGLVAPAVAAIREAGGLFIADEVQAGFGRSGEGMWCFTHHGVTPDLVTLGKPMGNGYPVAGVVARPELLDEFSRHKRYFNTFAGSEVACAAGMAVLDVIEAEALIDHAREIGAHLNDALLGLMTKHELIGDVRSLGLFVGVDLVKDRATKERASDEAACVVNALRQRRVLISTTGPGANVLKIRPPLVFSAKDADLLLGELDEVLAEVENGAG